MYIMAKDNPITILESNFYIYKIKWTKHPNRSSEYVFQNPFSIFIQIHPCALSFCLHSMQKVPFISITEESTQHNIQHFIQFPLSPLLGYVSDVCVCYIWTFPYIYSVKWCFPFVALWTWLLCLWFQFSYFPKWYSLHPSLSAFMENSYTLCLSIYSHKLWTGIYGKIKQQAFYMETINICASVRSFCISASSFRKI